MFRRSPDLGCAGHEPRRLARSAGQLPVPLDCKAVAHHRERQVDVAGEALDAGYSGHGHQDGEDFIEAEE
jgi:hypothetical protein